MAITIPPWRWKNLFSGWKNKEMAEYRLIALDLDGTLLDDRGNIPEANRQALYQRYQQGIIIALASGRMTDCIVPFAEILGFDCAIIAYNGAMVKARAAEKRQIIFHQPLPAVYADYLVDYCRENHFHLNYYLKDVLYARDEEGLKKYAELYSRQTGAVFHFVPDLAIFRGKQPTKLILITDVRHQNSFRTRDYQYQFFQQKLSGQVNLFRTNPEYLEFLKVGVDKGLGLLRLASFYGIDREAILSFGDGENDAEMLAAAGTGVALANAGEKAKQAADLVLDWTNNQAAIAR
ncbi:MAG TPA: HAD family hydrolase, partial [bacterium]|nr:HAD family hydrolase [bacterium]